MSAWRSLQDRLARRARLVPGWCLLVLAWLMPVASAAQTPLAATSRQIVIPFENSRREPRVHWLSEGSAVLLTDDLVALGAQAITRDARISAFDRLHVPPVATLSYATVIRLGQMVGATRVVLGSFELNGDELTVRARVMRLDTGRLFPEIVERGRLADLFLVFARVARRFVPDGPVTIEQMEEGHPSLPAFEQYVKGEVAESPTARVSFLSQALRLAPAFHRARLSLWDVHTDQGEHEEALAVVRQVPEGHSLARRARFLGAVSMLNLNQYQQAYDAFAALNRASPDAALLNNLGVAQLRRTAGAPGGKATTWFAEAANADPQDPDLFFNLGYAAWIDRDMTAAAGALREVVRRNPADDEAHYVLGVALQASGATAEGAREKELARQLSSVYAEWEARQPGTNAGTGAGTGAVPRGLERVKTDLDATDAPRLEDVIVASGQRDQRELAAFHFASGRRLFEGERDAEAIAELRRTVYLAPYEADAHLLLARAYLRTGRVSDAIDALKISIWCDDTLAAHLSLAEAYLQNREPVKARAEAQVVAARDPGNAAARQLLDRILASP